MTPDRSWLLAIDWLGRPPTSNAHRSMHFRAWGPLNKAWRDAGCQAARLAHLPVLDAIDIEAWGRYPNSRGLPDPAGIEPAVKAAVDGLRDAGVIADDTARYLPQGIRFLPPVVDRTSDQPALILRITDLTDASDSADPTSVTLHPLEPTP